MQETQVQTFCMRYPTSHSLTSQRRAAVTIAGVAARPKMLICGIEAIGLGTVASGCKFKFSSDYP